MQDTDTKEEPIQTQEWIEATVDDLRALIDSKADGFIQNIIKELHPADLAEVVNRLSQEERLYLFSLLEAKTASALLVELDTSIKTDILQHINNQQIADMIKQLESDDATDIIGDLPDDVADQILTALDKEDSDQVQELLLHEDDSAGGIMAKEFIVVNEKLTVDQAIQKIRHLAEEVEQIYDVFAVDDDNRLIGVVPLQDLLLARPGMRVHHIMDEDVVYVYADVDQEEVARLFKKYDLISIPVVDENKYLIGRITIDDIVDVMEDEASEDAQRLAGITEFDIRDTSPFRVSRSRFPWLAISFAGEIISGFLMSQFQTSLTKALYIVFFVPLIMAIGGNVGNQSAIVIIRGLATGEIGLMDVWNRLRGEIWVSLLLGITLAGGIYLISGFWFNNFRMGFVISLALLIVVINAALMGALFPFVLYRLKIDPAVATSPFITTSNDILGLLIYFGVITAFLQWF